MRKEIADKLVTALRSGEYDQTSGRLRNGDNFCCLGVLCDIAVKEGVIEPWQRVKIHGEGRLGFVVDIEGESYEETSVLPNVVKEWAGMRSANGTYNRGELDDTRALSSDNDNGHSFAKIADTIENRYAEL